MKSFLKSIPVSGKIFLIILIICAIPLIISYPLPKDYYGDPCGVDIGGNIEFILWIGMLLTASLAFVELVRSFIKKSHKIRIVIVLIVLILSLIISVAAIPVHPAMLKSLRAKIQVDMFQLRTSQEMFYYQKGRYANSQEELIEAGIIKEKFKNPLTNKGYTDKDGYGIEGGDNDPETWAATAFIPTREFDSWCRRAREGYWYTCHQDYQNWVCQEE